MVCLEMQDHPGYENVCRKMLPILRNHEFWAAQMLAVVICCVGPSKEVDLDELDRIAAGALGGPPNNYWYRLGNGIIAYRCGRHAEALETLPVGMHYYPAKAGLLALLFQAMLPLMLIPML